jgi:hypothetical protein
MIAFALSGVISRMHISCLANTSVTVITCIGSQCMLVTADTTRAKLRRPAPTHLSLHCPRAEGRICAELQRPSSPQFLGHGGGRGERFALRIRMFLLLIVPRMAERETPSLRTSKDGLYAHGVDLP